MTEPANLEVVTLSLMSTVAAPDAIGGGGDLADRDRYIFHFRRAGTGSPAPKWARPWASKGTSRFWSRYLHPNYKEGSGEQAWDRLAPLRGPLSVVPPQGETLDLFVWPHAAAAVLTVDVFGPATRDVVVSWVVEASRTRTYTAGASPKNALRLIRDHAREGLQAMGLDANTPTYEREEFSIATVRSGDDGMPTPEVDRDTRRAVFGLACLASNWRRLSPPDDGSLRISSHGARAGGPGGQGGLYGVKRGRAVWLPGLFGASRRAPERFESLKCYHQNLVALALQVEAQLALVRWAEPRLAGKALPIEAIELVRRAAGNLFALYLGDQSRTYASMSARRHIEDDPAFSAVKFAWDHFGLLLAPVQRSSG